jgi:hypothetical protein
MLKSCHAHTKAAFVEEIVGRHSEIMITGE